MKVTVKDVYRKLIVSSISAVEKIELVPLSNGEKRLKIMAKTNGDTCKIDSMGHVLTVRYDKKYTIEVTRDIIRLQMLINTFRGVEDENSLLIKELLPMIMELDKKVVIERKTDKDAGTSALSVKLYKTNNKKGVQFLGLFEYNPLLHKLQLKMFIFENEEPLFSTTVFADVSSDNGKYIDTFITDLRKEFAVMQKYMK